MSSPKQRFLDLCQEILERIQSIDKDTPWAEVEPAWWLGMMIVKRLISKILVPESRPELPANVVVFQVLSKCQHAEFDPQCLYCADAQRVQRAWFEMLSRASEETRLHPTKVKILSAHSDIQGEQ